jgi:hypothetical protein
MSVNDGFFEFGVNKNDGAVKSRSRKFKGEKGKRYRLSFAWWETGEDGKPNLDADTPKFVGVKRLYVDGVGYFIYRGPEFSKLANAQPRTAIGTIVVLWPTNAKGQLDKERLAENDVHALPWVFSQDKYEAFSPFHEEFHFGNHDMGAHCTDSQFQKMTFNPLKDGLLRKILDKGGALADQLLAEIAEVAESIQREMAQDLTLNDLREKMGSPTSSPTASTGSVGNVDEVLDDLLGED